MLRYLDPLHKYEAMVELQEQSSSGDDDIISTLNQIGRSQFVESTLLVKGLHSYNLKEIEKAIVRSDLGITPSNDGSVIRLVVPPLTAERRKELTKQVSKLGEEGKVALRNVRRDAMTKIKKMKTDKTLGEDEFASFEKKIEDLTTSYVKKTEDAVKAKEKV